MYIVLDIVIKSTFVVRLHFYFLIYNYRNYSKMSGIMI